ncbi:translation initiation factor IF-6 [Picrophilus oshimae]|uniref:Translation initiation factor 6 n=2 Tax=Picrophilus torridus (strain ATCC 700027 / DSM 9790 / JCM 10055 / NBRC 100828 / KAW 2/3) TaxID=1122961 RepID=IF6_PICTO|nr:translation initiation factor IF-6 [Picrophilus oshimae]Q6L2L0.1 RecName: Full=Translation initiation factor 6; Short=aIF-6 [Picrophilus oshimae DSM 9789]AAT42792.1 protein translation initiation factor 6 [Picrophilus oshimae DSM 9789]SMD31663.1 translation initiation factor 6 (aeIF-6) [Picrophilus oshimae DSM 9789]
MIKKVSILNSNFIGVYARTWNDVTFLPVNISDEEKRIFEETLKTEVYKISIGNSFLIGSMLSMNSNGIVVADHGIDNLKSLNINGRNILSINNKLNAAGNNIIANDHAALIHKSFPDSIRKKIEDVLGVETVKGSIAGIKTVGSVAVLNDRGMLVTSEADEDEIKYLSDLFKINVKTGTANFGSNYVGASIIANSNGILVGEATTSIELGRIDDTLS